MKILLRSIIALIALVALLSCTKEIPAELNVSTSELTFSKIGGNQSISFSTNKDWTASASASWVKVTPSGSSSSNSINVTVEPNSDFDDRTATITIKAETLTKTLNIKQSTNLGLFVTKDRYELTNEAQSIEIEVQTNVEFTINIDKSCSSWVSQYETKALSSNKLHFAIAANETYDNREGFIEITEKNGTLSEKITITQSQTDILMVSQAEFQVSSEQQALEIAVKSNINYDVEPDVEWIKIIGTKAISESILTVQIEENDQYESRLGLVVLKQKNGDTKTEVTIIQEAKPTIIYYTSTDGQIVVPTDDAFGYKTNNADVIMRKVISNTYNQDQGVIVLDGVCNMTGNHAFANSPNLSGIIIPDEIVSIGSHLFMGCDKLKTVQMPKKLKQILTSAFEGCTSLEIVNFPRDCSVEYLAGNCFYGCSSLSYFNLPNTVTNLGAGGKTFWGCSELTHLDISNVQSIGTECFKNCLKLESISLSKEKIFIGPYAFEECKSLKNIDIPETEYLSDGVFYGCTNLVNVKIQKGLKFIGDNCFLLCENLESVIIPEGVTEIRSRAFCGCKNLLRVSIPSTITNIGESAFQNCEKLEEITLPKGITIIPDNAFANCCGLSTVNIYGDVNYIGSMSFEGCSSLKSIQLPSSVISIGDRAFNKCSSLEEVNIPEGISRIEPMTFTSCEKLQEITIPSSITYIGGRAFTHSGLILIKCFAQTAPSLDNPNPFGSMGQKGVLFHPKGSDYSLWTTSYLPSSWSVEEF